jgi:hypothetical protein
LIYRSTDPVKRAIDVMCLIMLQLLTLMVLATEQNPEKLRNHFALSARSILARLDAGDTFDLPAPWIAAMRSVANQLLADLRISGFGFEPASTPRLTSPENPPARAKPKRRRPATRHRAAANISQAPRHTRRAPDHQTNPRREDRRPFEKIGLVRPGRSTPNSLRYQNKNSDRRSISRSQGVGQDRKQPNG